jgi:hypothetical protein
MNSISAIARKQAHLATDTGIERPSAENLNSIMPKIKQGSWRGNHHNEKYIPATLSDPGKRYEKPYSKSPDNRGAITMTATATMINDFQLALSSGGTIAGNSA